MATASGRRCLGSDKEVAAVTFNLKEQRCLEKTMQTLAMEESYARKLLELDQRIVRVSYKRLRDRVQKIKSHLKPNEIAELRTLEVEGKFKPQTSGVSLSSALKIASAARRLKLGQVETKKDNQRVRIKANASPLPRVLQKAHSLTGIFIDEPEEPEQKPRGASLEAGLNTVGRHPIARPSSGQRRAQTSTGFREMRNDSRSPRAQTSHGYRNGWSSHSEKKNGDRLDLHRASNVSNVSDFGVNPYEERRQSLLGLENLKSKNLLTRKQSFVQNVDEYVDANPVPPAISEEDPEEVRQSSKFKTLEERILEQIDRTDQNVSAKIPKTRDRRVPDALLHRPSRRVALIEGRKTSVSEEKVATFWRDITQCRYFSIPDNQLNVAGIVTMIKQQDKLNEKMDQPKETPETIEVGLQRSSSGSISATKNKPRPLSASLSSKSNTKLVTSQEI